MPSAVRPPSQPIPTPTRTPPAMHWTVDALDDRVARLETEEGEPLVVPRRLLPEQLQEGDVLRVELVRGAQHATVELVLDEGEMRARLERSAEQVAEADRLTTGQGDVAL